MSLSSRNIKRIKRAIVVLGPVFVVTACSGDLVYREEGRGSQPGEDASGPVDVRDSDGLVDAVARDTADDSSSADVLSDAPGDLTDEDAALDVRGEEADVEEQDPCRTPGDDRSVAVNFQPAGGAPSGWQADSGLRFDPRRGRGWSRDLSAATRRRGMVSDPLLDTAIFPGSPSGPDTWELELPPNRYAISLRSGDPLSEQGPNKVVAEGRVLLDARMSAAGEFLRVDDELVEVCDGRLTLTIGDGASDTALNWIKVETTQEDAPSCTPSTEVCNAVDDDCDSEVDEGGVCDPTPEPGCVFSSLTSPDAIRGAGFALNGGTFRDGGWAVDQVNDNLAQRFPGDYSSGYIRFDAKGLDRIIPLDPNNHGCERFIFNMNYLESAGPTGTRMWFATMENNCAGRPRGNLRIGLADGQCCNDSGRLPAQSDGAWHQYEVSWTPDRIRLTIDGQVWIDGGSGGAHVGSDPKLLFGSEGVSGDQSNAVFRNLSVCKGQP